MTSTGIMIVVFWCSAAAPIDTFNPHILHAAQSFVAANPNTCHASPAEEVDGPQSVGQCRGQALIRYMPGWLQRNPGKLYLYAECFERKAEPLDLEAMKRKVTP